MEARREASTVGYGKRHIRKYVLTLLHPPEAAHILDLCCGYGRHSIPLARHAFQVTGIDLSAIQIQRAREVASKAHVHPDFHVADARKLNFQGAFDFVLSMFVSFGFFNDENENKAMLHGVFRALKPGGSFYSIFGIEKKKSGSSNQPPVKRSGV